MTLQRLAVYILLAVALGLVLKSGMSASRTRLPFGTTDLATVEPQLQRLDPEERQLVRDYVVRSGGDVLPERFADPEAPLTARTFGQAIALQRRYLAQRAVLDAELDVRRAERAAKLAPLRSVLEVQLVRRQIVPSTTLYSPPQATPGAAIAALPDDKPVAVTTWRIKNVSAHTVESFRGGVHVRRAGTGFTYVGQLDECWIEHDEPIRPGSSAQIQCGQPGRDISSAQRAYVAMPARALAIEWIPKRIELAGGRSLVYDGD